MSTVEAYQRGKEWSGIETAAGQSREYKSLIKKYFLLLNDIKFSSTAQPSPDIIFRDEKSDKILHIAFKDLHESEELINYKAIISSLRNLNAAVMLADFRKTAKSLPTRKTQPLTAKSLLESGLIGLWRDRTDIQDSSKFARLLRERAEQRDWE